MRSIFCGHFLLWSDTQSAQAKEQQGKNIVKIVVPVVAAAVVILGLLLCCCLCAYRQKQNNNTSAQSRHLFASAGQ
jgi:heme/copper-type cytochrome/quinol oxidase subunit 2